MANACSWCGAAVQAADLSCPSCGAEVDLAALVSESGWVQLPGRRDMAKLQFGHSYCQIEGSFVPVADVALAGDDFVYFSHHVLLWMEPNVRISAMPRCQRLRCRPSTLRVLGASLHDTGSATNTTR